MAKERKASFRKDKPATSVPPAAFRSRDPEPELPEVVFALVKPLGTASAKVQEMIRKRLGTYGFDTELVRVSEVIMPGLAQAEPVSGSGRRAASNRIEMGNKLRQRSGTNAILAWGAASEIHRIRNQREAKGAANKKVAYLITSLRHPEEVAELRRIYGTGFFLIAVHTSKEQRLKNLVATGAGMSRAEAMELIDRDEHEPEAFGQHTRDTFHLADFFVADEQNDDKLGAEIERCLDLVYGHPFLTPTFNEFAMFMAFAASARSADLSRQVGAVVAQSREILATGANDCPRSGGGLYWPEFHGNRIEDAPRGRDYKRGFDSNSAAKTQLVQAVAERFPPTQRADAEKLLTGSAIRDITEYGRVVHAEMEALLACARRGVSCVGATLFCTTFPCHNCAKHIIAAGIKEVVFVEPYPKSRAIEFHEEAISMERGEAAEGRVRFKPFIGVGPRSFLDLFSMSLSAGREINRKDANGRASSWDPSQARPRLHLSVFTHRQYEQLATERLKAVLPRRK